MRWMILVLMMAVLAPAAAAQHVLPTVRYHAEVQVTQAWQAETGLHAAPTESPDWLERQMRWLHHTERSFQGWLADQRWIDIGFPLLLFTAQSFNVAGHYGMTWPLGSSQDVIHLSQLVLSTTFYWYMYSRRGIWLSDSIAITGLGEVLFNGLINVSQKEPFFWRGEEDGWALFGVEWPDPAAGNRFSQFWASAGTFAFPRITVYINTHHP